MAREIAFFPRLIAGFSKISFCSCSWGPNRSLLGQCASAQVGRVEVLDATGAPEVKLEGTIPGGKIVDTAVQGALTMPLTGATSMPALIAGAMGGAASEAAGQATEGLRNPGACRWWCCGRRCRHRRTMLDGKTAKAAKATVTPFTESGRDRLVGETLRNRAADPDTTIKSIDDYTIASETFPTQTPDFRLPTGKAS
ncbi:hypothetical protein [Reyranella sp.]|uniref:hypothetical protein n=1 Tax=Reyranella sp. TaxID=1929291 RepID=UPI00121070F4|nr:hypothetical protein [Reyranella sp.]TAJ91010.1 MAG: hypothetical protein EPO50_00325 [Reyranella sp.]